MQNLKLPPPLPPPEGGWKFRAATDDDYDGVVEASVFVRDHEGKPLLVFEVLPTMPSSLVRAFQGIEYNTSARTDGLVTHSGVLGFLPRVTLRRDFCTRAAMGARHPEAHAEFLRWGAIASESFKRQCPAEHAAQEKLLSERVRPEWRIPDSVYTSGIANRDNPLSYHKDTGNFPGTWNAMYAVAFDCRGGLLVLPEYRLAFDFSRPAFINFPAQRVVHGVTAIEPRSKLAARFSVVYYALQGMKNCLGHKEELNRIRNLKTQRERKRASPPAGNPRGERT